MIHVRDLVEDLQKLPPEMRLRLVVECLDGTVAGADDYRIRVVEDVQELRFVGAVVRQIVK
jgi:hypothetical protein